MAGLVRPDSTQKVLSQNIVIPSDFFLTTHNTGRSQVVILILKDICHERIMESAISDLSFLNDNCLVSCWLSGFSALNKYIFWEL